MPLHANVTKGSNPAGQGYPRTRLILPPPPPPVGQTFTQVVTSLGALGYWKLDDDTGVMVDSSGNGRNGAYSGGSPITSHVDSPFFGGGSEFFDTAVLNAGTVPFAAWFDAIAAFTLLIFVKTGVGGSGVVGHPGANVPTTRYGVGATAGLGVKLRIFGPGANVDGAIDPCDGAWHQIGGSYDSAVGTARTIMDGVRGVETTGLIGPTLTNPGAGLIVGSWTPVTNGYTGRCAGMVLFNYELSPVQLATLYASRLVGP